MKPLLFGNPLLQQQFAQDPQNLMAQQLMQQGSSTAPVQSWGEGLARALQAPLGGMFASQARGRYQKEDDQYRAAMSKALQGGDVVQNLSNSGDPSLQNMALQAQLAKALKDPAETWQTLSEEEEIAAGFDPSGTYQRSSTGKTDTLTAPQAKAKLGDTRKYRKGDREITEQFTEGGWQMLGEGAAFAPPANQSVSVNLPKSINAGDVKTMQIGAEATSQAQEVLPLFAIARESAKQFPQSGALGKGALLLERGKALFGLENNAQAGEVLQAMQTRLGSMLRIPGSGATSDMEMSLYMQGVPSLLNTQQGNVALADIGEKLMKRRIKNYQALQDYIVKNDSSAGYQPDETPVLTPEETQLLLNGGNAPAPEGGEQAPMLEFTDPADPKLQALPSGSAFYAIQPDGSKKLKFKP
jgi:hypothetical protein